MTVVPALATDPTMPGARRVVDRDPVPLDAGLAGGFVVRRVHPPGAEPIEIKACERRRLRGVPGSEVHTAMPAGQATPVPPWPQ